MESDQRVCLPTILLKWKMPKQSVLRPSVVLITPIWLTQPWFAMLVLMVIIRRIQIPAKQDLLTNHRGESHPQISQGSLNPSRVASIRISLSAEEAASKFILASWKTSREGAYLSYLRQWERWCTERRLEAIQSPLSAILELLTLEFLQGKAIYSYRSAIAMTYGAIDGVIVGKPSRLMKGIHN